jgi:alpha-tubulin suppressor-like RCC1 family protein
MSLALCRRIGVSVVLCALVTVSGDACRRQGFDTGAPPGREGGRCRDGGDCDPRLACVADICVADREACSPVGVACPCTQPADCELGDPCQMADCIGGECAYTSRAGSCDDGLFCNGADMCEGGMCAHAGDPCSGGIECNTTCNESAGTCFDPAGSGCSDNNPMDCWAAACDGAGGCNQADAPQASAAVCADGLFCNGPDTCDSTGDCSGHGGDPCSPGACDEGSDACAASGPLPGFVEITPGEDFTCALTTAGVAYCWGSDLAGKLGNGGTAVDAQSPTTVDTSPIVGNKAFVQLAAGRLHACGLTADGVAYCWGSDDSGQLGNGGASVATQSPSAVDVGPIAGSKAFIQLTAGGDHTCGLGADGAAYCWGWDNRGQLGNGGGSANSQSPSPVDTAPIGGNKAFARLTAGSLHTCGLTVEGVAYCWGLDNNGRLGNGGVTANTQSPSAVDTSTISGNKAFIQLNAGGNHTCGLTAGGVAYCWGWDFYAQLGNGGASLDSQSPSAVDTTPIVGNKAFVQLTGGGNHGCGLTADGVAYCWGSDGHGQLGNGGTSVNLQSPSPVATAALSGNKAFVQLSAGGEHTCGLAADGEAYCWGWDDYGRLGNGGGATETQSPSPVDSSTLTANQAFVQLSGGAYHTCGLTTGGRAYCWGSDGYGGLGNGGAAANTQSPSPVDTSSISGNKAFVQLSAGTDHTCGRTADGVAYCWGSDTFDELGNGAAAANTQSPSPVDISTLSGNTAFVHLTAGREHTCGLTADGVAYCWGWDLDGRLGNGGAAADSESPSAVDTAPIAGNKLFVHLTAGADHTCGLTAGGVAYCWGSDGSGQLGNGGVSVDSQSPSPVDTSTVSGNRTFVQLTAGVASHTCGLTAGGAAYCWGWDSFGQLGNGAAFADSQNPSPVDTAPSAGQPFVQLIATRQTCGVTAGSAAYCWGSDSFGGLGNGGTSVDTESPSAVDTAPISGNQGFVQLTAGWFHTCGLTADGVTYCWGDDDSGQLGNGGVAADTQSPSAVDMSTL